MSRRLALTGSCLRSSLIRGILSARVADMTQCPSAGTPDLDKFGMSIDQRADFPALTRHDSHSDSGPVST